VAKLALIEREKKRARLVQKYSAKRAALKAIIDDTSKSDEERYEARLQIQQLPRNANPTRKRNRCWRVTRFAKSRSAARSLA